MLKSGRINIFFDKFVTPYWYETNRRFIATVSTAVSGTTFLFSTLSPDRRLGQHSLLSSGRRRVVTLC